VILLLHQVFRDDTIMKGLPAGVRRPLAGWIRFQEASGRVLAVAGAVGGLPRPLHPARGFFHIEAGLDGSGFRSAWIGRAGSGASCAVRWAGSAEPRRGGTMSLGEAIRDVPRAVRGQERKGPRIISVVTVMRAIRALAARVSIASRRRDATVNEVGEDRGVPATVVRAGMSRFSCKQTKSID